MLSRPLVALVVVSGLLAAAGDSRAARRAPRAPRPPVAFEPNVGFAPDGVRFVARCRRAALLVSDAGAVLAKDGARFALSFEGAAPGRVEAGAKLPGRSAYFVGDDPSRWRTGVPQFGTLSRRGLYDGVDLAWHGEDGRLEYDFVVAPGADPSQVRVAFGGAESVTLLADGALRLRSGGVEALQHAPAAYQEKDGVRRDVECRYVLDGAEATLALGGYDRSRTLVVDPVVTYSTYLGGAGADAATAVEADAAGAVYVAGSTESLDFPVTGDPLPTYKGGGDTFVAKLDADGRTVLFATYLGGNGIDMPYGLKLSGGSIVVAGETFSPDFPRINPTQPLFGGRSDAFVVKLDAATGAPLFATTIGGAGEDRAAGLAVDSTGRVLIVGKTASANFPNVRALQPTHAQDYVEGEPGNDAFVVRLTAAGAIDYATYLGGDKDDRALAVAAGPSGEAYVCGMTSSSNFPTKGAIRGTEQGLADAFVAKIGAAGDSLVYSTYLGSLGFDEATAIDVDPATGKAYVAGFSDYGGFPVVGALQNWRGARDAFVCVMNAAGGALDFSTYLGGRRDDEARAIRIDQTPGRRIYVAGLTYSENFPVTSNAYQASLGDPDIDAGAPIEDPSVRGDAFLAVIAADRSSIEYATYLGGRSFDAGNALAIETRADAVAPSAFVAGVTRSTDFPTYGAVQAAKRALDEAFVAKIAPRGPKQATGLAADLVTASAVSLSWKDQADDETGYQLQRSTSGGAFEVLATLPPNAQSFHDATVAPATDYVYRVVATDADGLRSVSASLVVSSLPVPPAAPGAPTVIEQDSNRVRLGWADQSGNEQGFQIQRGAAATGPFALIGETDPDVATFADAVPVAASTDVWYRVRGFNLGGFSTWSAATKTTVDPSLKVTLQGGRLVLKKRARSSRINAQGVYANADGGAAAVDFDPSQEALRLEIGGADGPFVLDIPAGDIGWRGRRGKLVWTNRLSPRFAPYVRVCFDLRRNRFTVAARRFDFPAAPTNPVTVGFVFGLRGGADTSTWNTVSADELVHPLVKTKH